MSEQITWNDLSTPEKRFLNFMVGNNGEYTFYVTDVLKKAAGKDLLTIGKTKGNGTERKALCQITEFGKRLQIEGTYNAPVPVQLAESEPSAGGNLAAQLAAAQQRIAELEAALKDSLNICRQPLAGNTMRARYDSMLDQQARIMEIASKALKGTQS